MLWLVSALVEPPIRFWVWAMALTIDVAALGSVGWLVALAVVLSVVGKMGGGFAAGRLGGFTARQSINVGAALVAHGEFTIILAQIAGDNEELSGEVRRDIDAFAGTGT